MNTPAPTNLGTAIIELFDKAAAHLQYPKMRFPFANVNITIYRQGKNSANAGGLAITGNGGNDYYGRIDRRGNVQLKLTAPKEVTQILQDPQGVAIMLGKASNHCCYCGLALTNKSSVYHGYGPICAGKWGLPWGDVPAEDEVQPDTNSLEGL